MHTSVPVHQLLIRLLTICLHMHYKHKTCMRACVCVCCVCTVTHWGYWSIHRHQLWMRKHQEYLPPSAQPPPVHTRVNTSFNHCTQTNAILCSTYQWVPASKDAHTVEIFSQLLAYLWISAELTNFFLHFLKERGWNRLVSHLRIKQITDSRRADDLVRL